MTTQKIAYASAVAVFGTNDLDSLASSGTLVAGRESGVIDNTSNLYIDALLAERRGYVQRGLDDRVSAVDEALAARGYKVPTPGASRGSSAASGA